MKNHVGRLRATPRSRPNPWPSRVPSATSRHFAEKFVRAAARGAFVAVASGPWLAAAGAVPVAEPGENPSEPRRESGEIVAFLR